MLSTIFTALTSICIGFLPSLIWLVFWLREDPHPEPVRSLIRAFAAGALSVPGVIIFEFAALALVSASPLSTSIESLHGGALLFVLVAWALVEEAAKLLVGLGSLSSKEDDEPIDPAIYLITTALGFAAVENTLFILSPLSEGNALGAVLAFNSRFVGATLLHVLCSGLIGVCIGLAFRKKLRRRIAAGVGGLILATVLHSLFNGFIIATDAGVATFVALWIFVIVLIFLLHTLTKRPHHV